MTQLSYRERHNVHELCFTRSKVKYKKSYFLRSTNEVLIYFIWYLDIDFQGTVTCFLRMCGVLISGLVNLFSRFAFGEKSSSVDPEMPDKAIISVFKSYLVYFGSFKCHILYFCASIVEKIGSHSAELH